MIKHSYFLKTDTLPYNLQWGIQVSPHDICTYNIYYHTFTRKYVHFAYVILTLPSSTNHFSKVHNLYHAQLAKTNIGGDNGV